MEKTECHVFLQWTTEIQSIDVSLWTSIFDRQPTTILQPQGSCHASSRSLRERDRWTAHDRVRETQALKKAWTQARWQLLDVIKDSENEFHLTFFRAGVDVTHAQAEQNIKAKGGVKE